MSKTEETVYIFQNWCTVCTKKIISAASKVFFNFREMRLRTESPLLPPLGDEGGSALPLVWLFLSRRNLVLCATVFREDSIYRRILLALSKRLRKRDFFSFQCLQIWETLSFFGFPTRSRRLRSRCRNFALGRTAISPLFFRRSLFFVRLSWPWERHFFLARAKIWQFYFL